MKTKITVEQRNKILALLQEGLDRNAIGTAVGVTPGQVSAVAAHLKMKSYGKSSLQDARVSKVVPNQRSLDIASSLGTKENRIQRAPAHSGSVSVLMGRNIDTSTNCYWTPTPESGTPNPHLLIVGESGSGKTYATQCICAELSQQRLPTIVFDFGQGFALNTADPEFIEFAKPIEINVSRDGVNINPLQIFPSDVHGPVNVAQRIADTFAQVYPMIGVQQHAVLRQAVLNAFLEAGIDPKSSRTWHLKPPRFGELKLLLDAMAEDTEEPSRRYAGAVASHISTVFVFNTFRATGLDLDWRHILSSEGHTYIVQLKGLENLLERIVTELLLWNLIGYIESLGPGPLRCFVLLDEAHRLSFASNSPVEKILREGRKFGLGVLLASQQPEDFSPVAFTNTASKLIFNVTDERGAVARQIARKSGGSNFLKFFRQLGTLPRGQACYLTSDSAGIVQVASFADRRPHWRSVT